VRPEHRELVGVRHYDRRSPLPAEPFDVVLCRDVAFTSLAAAGQRAVLDQLTGALRPGGALAVRLHEFLPQPRPGLAPWPSIRAIFRRA
jgi:chemotaxis protein methyltransferase CheR